ncbi:MAG: hypothetical protein KGS00_12120 [Alphaproteobacteria bacterium]|nr:hypothetical protein [Alphaproteobacteria bacterium]
MKGTHVRRFLAIILGCLVVSLDESANAHAQDAAVSPTVGEAVADAATEQEETPVEQVAPWRLALSQYEGGAQPPSPDEQAGSAFGPLAIDPASASFSQGVMYDPGAALLIAWSEGGAWPGPEIRSYQGAFSPGVAYPVFDALSIAFAEAAARQSPGARRWLASLSDTGVAYQLSGSFLSGRPDAGSAGLMYSPGWAAFASATEAMRWWRLIHGPSAGAAFLMLEAGYGFTSGPSPEIVEAYIWRRQRRW